MIAKNITDRLRRAKKQHLIIAYQNILNKNFTIIDLYRIAWVILVSSVVNSAVADTGH